MRLSEFAPNPNNPRVISEENLTRLGISLSALGDLSGLVFNRRTGKLVGGHQRIKVLQERLGAVDPEIVLSTEFDAPTENGTVALGHVQVEGEAFHIRIVDWDAKTEKTALIAANNEHLMGSCDTDGLAELLEGSDLDLSEQIGNLELASAIELPDSPSKTKEPGNEDDENGDIKQLVMYFSNKDFPEVVKYFEGLRAKHGVEDNASAILSEIRV